MTKYSRISSHTVPYFLIYMTSHPILSKSFYIWGKYPKFFLLVCTVNNEHTTTVEAVCSLCEAKKGEKFPFFKKVTLPVGCFCAREASRETSQFSPATKKKLGREIESGRNWVGMGGPGGGGSGSLPLLTHQKASTKTRTKTTNGPLHPLPPPPLILNAQKLALCVQTDCRIYIWVCVFPDPKIPQQITTLWKKVIDFPALSWDVAYQTLLGQE